MAHRGASKKTYLLSWTVAPKTLQQYKTNVHSFLQWCADNDEAATSYDDIDDLMVAYFHHLYETGCGPSRASNTLNGLVCLQPRFKDKLATARRALKGWQKQTPSKSYPPLTWELAVLMAVQLLRQGKRREGIGLLLAFDCFLRVSELCGLRRSDVADDQDKRVSGEHKGMLIRLASTKTGPNKWVRVLDPSVRQLVRDLVDETKSGDMLFPFSTGVFRRSFKAVAAELGLSALYVPHSLRHGGATRYYHVLGMTIEGVLERGRWASTKSARRYIQAGVAMLLEQEAPEEMVRLGLAMSKRILRFVALAQMH
jgi:integrase